MKLHRRLGLAWRVLRARTSNLYAHAVAELPPAASEYSEAINRGVLELVLVFGTQGHSGMSAGFTRQALAKLLDYQPLRPLTGNDDEWNEVGPGLYQNRRCSRVFKDADRFGGQAYDIEGRVFREPDGACYVSADSFTPVTFPYRPTTEYVDRPASRQED